MNFVIRKLKRKDIGDAQNRPSGLHAVVQLPASGVAQGEQKKCARMATLESDWTYLCGVTGGAGKNTDISGAVWFSRHDLEQVHDHHGSHGMNEDHPNTLQDRT
jgi:hypothetical protein